MADLNYFTLKYKHAEREQKVSDLGTSSLSLRLCWSSDGRIHVWFSLSVPTRALSPLFLPSQYHQLQDEYFTSAVVLALVLATLFGLIYLLVIPQ